MDAMIKKWPFPMRVGILFAALALLSASVSTIVVNFIIGVVVGSIVLHVDKSKWWRHAHYWLRGGIMGGGITLIYSLLLMTCDLFPGSGWGCFIVIFYLGPLYPTVWLLDKLQPIFGYSDSFAWDHGWQVGILIWFAIGALIGLIFQFTKKSHR